MGEKKSGKIVGVRFDDEERAALEESAERLGLTKSEYIRYLVSLNFPTFTDEHGDESDGLGDVSTLIVPVLDKSDVQVIKRELIRQGSNINQAAKALNSLARLAGENKALRIDWISFGGVAERALESANESLKEIGARVDASPPARITSAMSTKGAMAVPMLKAVWGHTPVSKSGGGADCFRYLKYGNGREGVKRYLEKDARSLATDLINLPFVEEKNGDWGAEMDATRAAMRGRQKHGGRARTFAHFIMSPDKKDDVDLPTLRDLAVAWATEMFGMDGGLLGEAEVAIEYHDDNERRIPHAHIVVNNVDLRTGKALHIDAQQSSMMASRLQQLAWERGLRGFDQRGVSRLASEEPDERKPDRFANAPQRRKTMTERAMERDGRPSWKQEIKDAIEVACNMASTPEEVVDRLAQMGIVALPRQAKRVRPGEDYIFYYPQPGVPIEENKKRVSGERLGARYTAAGMRAQIRASYYRKLYAEDKDAAALLDMLVDVRDVELQRGQTLADLSKAFAAISNFRITNMQDAKHLQAVVDKQIKEGIEAGRPVQASLEQAAQLEALLRIGPAANIVPAMREQSRSAQAMSAVEAKQKRREQAGEKIPLVEKIERGYRLTKEEYTHLQNHDRAALRAWQQNRRAVKQGRKPTARLGGGGSKAPGSSSYNHAGPQQGFSRGARSR